MSSCEGRLSNLLRRMSVINLRNLFASRWKVWQRMQTRVFGFSTSLSLDGNFCLFEVQEDSTNLLKRKDGTMRKVAVALVMLIACSGASAQSTTSSEKVSFYKGCMPSCQSNQRRSPDNVMFKDVPFIMDAYCSCYCARVSMRLTKPQANLLMRGAMEGRDVSGNKSISRLIEDSGEKCLAAFID